MAEKKQWKDLPAWQKKVKTVLSTFLGLLLLTVSMGCDDPQGQAILKQMPEQQKELHAHLAKTEQLYSSAPNELKKSKVFRESSTWLSSYYRKNNGRIVNFIGKLAMIGTDEGGKNAYIEIEANVNGKEISFKTWNNLWWTRFSDHFFDLLLHFYSI